MKLNDLKIDSSAKEEGAWHRYDDLGLRFKVRGEGSLPWLVAQERIARQISIENSVRGVLPIELRQKLDREVVIEAGLLDWDGLENDEGEPLPFSKDKAVELLNDPDFDTLLQLIRGACRAVAVSQADITEDAAKN